MNSSNDSANASAESSPSPAQVDPVVLSIEDWGALGLSSPENRHGQSVRVWAQASPGQAADALAYATLAESAWRFRSDAAASAADSSAALYSMALMHVGLVASYMNEIFGAAETRDVDVHELGLTQDSYYLTGDPCLPDAASAQAFPLELEIRIASSTAADELGEMLLGALTAAPQNGLLRQSTDTELTLLSGTSAALHAAMRDATPGRPDDFAAAWTWPAATRDAFAPVVTRLEDTTGEPTSLSRRDAAAQPAPTQLHGRAISTLNQDGGKRIEHRWRGGAAPAYAFLSDEAEGFGGQTLAPDAATYMAAGLALSLVTQLARATAAAHGPTELCRAIVDVHFPFGGLIEPGTSNLRLDPLEIQVALSGDEDPVTASALVRRSLRACPLQALCRTRLVTNIRIRTF